MQSIIFYNKNTNFIDRFLIIFILIIPLTLTISIFTADLLTSISGLILITKFFKKEDISIFKSIKKEIIFFSILFLIILISLILTNYKSEAFLPSFFYFRYFLLSLVIFYLLKKYNFFFNTFYITILFSIGLVILDAMTQHFFGYNLLGYKIASKIGGGFLSGFFDEEKKLGSYLVRFLPLILSIIYFKNPKISTKSELAILGIVGIVIFLASERTALFLLILIYFFYFLISKKKFFFLSITAIIFILLFTFQKKLTYKYINFTLKQTGLYLLYNPSPRPIDKDIVRYFSYEHENLSYTGFLAFKENYLFGNGIKSFYFFCRDNLEKFQFKTNERNNRLVCSTHPHNTYVQILSEIGIFGFLIVLYLFFKTLVTNLKILLIKNKNNLIKSYFFINLTILVNLMPLIPSGSFFNNWMSLVLFFPIGFLLYIKDKVPK